MMGGGRRRGGGNNNKHNQSMSSSVNLSRSTASGLGGGMGSRAQIGIQSVKQINGPNLKQDEDQIQQKEIGG